MGKLTRSVDGLRRTARACGLLMPLLLAGACSDGSTPLIEMPSAAPLASRGGSTSSLHPNSAKYHDSSRPATTGRSGTATLTGYAARGEDGTVLLTLASGGLADPGSGRGQIAKAQVKAFGPDGALIFTLNFQKIDQGRVTLTLPALPYGSRLAVQANVRGIDGRRTDVVELTDELRAAPSLSAELTAPEAVLIGSPTIISGTVAETSGDIGLRADVVLSVNGVEVDRVSNIWIDAGDAVSFAFVYAFDDPGANDVHVEVQPIPDPAYPTPDAASDQATVMATPGVLAGHWSAEAEDQWTTHAWVYDYTWADGAEHKSYRDSSSHVIRDQSVAVQGTAVRGMTFPISLDLELRSGGILKHEEHWPAVDGVLQEDGQTCIAREITEQGSAVLICTSGSGASAVTTFSYHRFAQTITYHSDGFADYFDGQTQSVTTWNDTYMVKGVGGQPWSWGGDVSFSLALGDPAGSVVIHPSVTLAPFSQVLDVSPRTCVSHPWGSRPWVTLTECNASSDGVEGVRGSAEGEG